MHGPGTQLGEEFDNPLERLRLLSGDDDAIATFLDELDVQSPREREMLAELARPSVLARPTASTPTTVARSRRWRASGATASTARRRARASARSGSSSVRGSCSWSRATSSSPTSRSLDHARNLYWMREMEAPPDSRKLKLLRPARFDANYLVEIMRSQEIGVPSFVIAGLLIPLGASIWRLMTGFTFDDWWVALLIGLVGVAIGVALSWIVLREAPWRAPASASRSEAAAGVWDSVGHCGRPPKDGSRRFAIISIVLMVGVWVVFPAIVALALAV